MTNEISFEENQYKIRSRSILSTYQVPAMTKFLINKGIVKTEKTAHIILLSTIGLFFLASIYVFVVFVLDVNIGSSNTITPEQIQENRERAQLIMQKMSNDNNN